MRRGAQVKQEELSGKKAEAAKGTMRAAVRKFRVGAAMMFCIAASIYDAKPVHVISTIHTVATLVDKERVVWRPEEGKRMKVSFPRLNIIDDYN